VRYEWDERKNRQNQRRHGGISFELAALVFEDEHRLIGLDRVDDAGEQRWHVIGAVRLSQGSEMCCSWCMDIGRKMMAKSLSALSARGGLTRMTTEDIVNRKWTDAEKQSLRRASEARAAGLDLPEKEYEDIPRLTEEQLSSLVRLRGARRKVAVSVRLDPQVLEWLRAKGEGHLTRINDILVNLMEAERRAGPGR
jgi:uncharacterized DUF497 family protein/uncharacterized protein (DUF4415 family)